MEPPITDADADAPFTVTIPVSWLATAGAIAAAALYAKLKLAAAPLPAAGAAAGDSAALPADATPMAKAKAAAEERRSKALKLANQLLKGAKGGAMTPDAALAFARWRAAGGSRNPESLWTRYSCKGGGCEGEYFVHDDDARELTLAVPREGVHGEQEEDEADFAQFFEPLLKRKEFEESLNPASKWIRYACGERAFYGVGGDADAKPQLEEPEEGVKGELQLSAEKFERKYAKLLQRKKMIEAGLLNPASPWTRHVSGDKSYYTHQDGATEAVLDEPAQGVRDEVSAKADELAIAAFDARHNGLLGRREAASAARATDEVSAAAGESKRLAMAEALQAAGVKHSPASAWVRRVSGGRAYFAHDHTLEQRLAAPKEGARAVLQEEAAAFDGAYRVLQAQAKEESAQALVTQKDTALKQANALLELGESAKAKEAFARWKNAGGELNPGSAWTRFSKGGGGGGVGGFGKGAKSRPPCYYQRRAFAGEDKQPKDMCIGLAQAEAQFDQSSPALPGGDNSGERHMRVKFEPVEQSLAEPDEGVSAVVMEAEGFWDLTHERLRGLTEMQAVLKAAGIKYNPEYNPESAWTRYTNTSVRFQFRAYFERTNPVKRQLQCPVEGVRGQSEIARQMEQFFNESYEPLQQRQKMVEAGLLNPKSRWTRYTAGKSRELFYNHDVKKAGLSSYSREVPAGGYKDVQQLEATDFDPVYMYMIKQLVSAKKAAKVGEVIVTLAAIEKRPELNGLKAELVGFDAATGRYQVKLDEKVTKKLVNLLPAKVALPPGAEVVLRELSVEEYNGQRATIVGTPKSPKEGGGAGSPSKGGAAPGAAPGAELRIGVKLLKGGKKFNVKLDKLLLARFAPRDLVLEALEEINTPGAAK